MSDPLGHNIHTALALLYLFTLPLTTAAKDIAMVALVVWWCIRLPRYWRSYSLWRANPLIWAMIAWFAWSGLSLSWSLDPAQGVDEFRALRALLVPVLVWPVLDRLPWLVGALLAGVLGQNFAQLLHALNWFNVRPDEGTGRYGGWINPIHTGAFCVASMCWNLSANLNARGRLRWISLTLLVIAAAGLLASGSRGPWLAAAVAIPLMLLVTAIRRPPTRRLAIALMIIGPLAAAAAWPIVGDKVERRLEVAAKEAQQARENHVYWTSVGVRIGMTRWTWDIFRDHPVVGVGAGGYPIAQNENPDFQAGLAKTRNKDERGYMSHEHPHSIYFYTLACLGTIGAIILAAVIILSLRQAWRDPPDHPYADAALFAIIAWFIGAQFDSYILDGHRLGLFAFMLAITMPLRPRITILRTSPTPSEAHVH
ncbi:MAG: O-antigen ligase family protein [Phycisphaerales bacterium]|nr:O-antigen ligase family protein [Phycisphaerales bacterium]